jgi:hypothetical protein
MLHLAKKLNESADKLEIDGPARYQALKLHLHDHPHPSATSQQHRATAWVDDHRGDTVFRHLKLFRGRLRKIKYPPVLRRSTVI